MTTETPGSPHESYTTELGLWTGILGPPIGWLVHFQIVYSLVPRVCKLHAHAIMHLITLVFLIILMACGLVAWKLLPASTGGNGNNEPIETIPARPRFMAQVGIMSSALFTLVLIAQWIASFMLDPCWN